MNYVYNGERQEFWNAARTRERVAKRGKVQKKARLKKNDKIIYSRNP